MTTQTIVQGTAAFSKSIGVLCLIADAETPPDTSELLKISGLPRATLHRILQSLVAEQLVTARDDKTFVLAPRIIKLAARALEQNDITQLADPALDLLCAKTKETVHFAVFTNGSLLYTCKKDSPHAIRIASSLGSAVPWHASAIGQSVLAALPDKEKKERLGSLEFEKFTAHTLTSTSGLRRRIEEVNDQGYSVAHQETDLDVECYGVCIRNPAGYPVGGISVSVPLFRHSGRKEDYTTPLMKCRDSIEKMLISF